MRKIAGILSISAFSLFVISTAALSSECKIEGLLEKQYQPVTPAIREFLTKETQSLFFNENATYENYMQVFSLSKKMPGDIESWWGNKYYENGYARGRWYGAKIIVRDGVGTGYNKTNSVFGPPYSGNGLAHVTSKPYEHPYNLGFYRNLKTKFFSSDVVNAIAKKFNLSDVSNTVDSDGWMRVKSKDSLYETGIMPFKSGQRYFTFNITVHGLKDYDTGMRELENTIIRYNVDVHNTKEYTKCIKLKEEGKDIKL